MVVWQVGCTRCAICFLVAAWLLNLRVNQYLCRMALRRICFVLVALVSALFGATTVQAQPGNLPIFPDRPNPYRQPGEVTYRYESVRIARMDSMLRETPPALEGYRVQLFFGNKTMCEEKREEFLRAFPDERAYISYLAPNFRLRVGDFRNRLECERFKQSIQDKYPGCYIVKDFIELPRLPEVE